MPSSGARLRAAKRNDNQARPAQREAREGAWREGFDDHQNGVTFALNPHPMGTEGSKYWSKGWRFAALG